MIDMISKTLGRLPASMAPRSDNYFVLFNALTASIVPSIGAVMARRTPKR